MSYSLILIFIFLSFAHVYPMNYMLAPFKYTYKAGRFIFGKTYLEQEVDLLLKTTVLPWDNFTEDDELEKFLGDKIEKHLSKKAEASPAFFAYLVSLSVFEQKSLLERIDNTVNAFVSKELQKELELLEEFAVIPKDETKSKLKIIK